VLLTIAWIFAYICRHVAWVWLCAKALDKVTPSQVAEVVAAFMATGADRPGRAASHRHRLENSAASQDANGSTQSPTGP
jgi:hypothetical protein